MGFLNLLLKNQQIHNAQVGQKCNSEKEKGCLQKNLVRWCAPLFHMVSFNHRKNQQAQQI